MKAFTKQIQVTLVAVALAALATGCSSTGNAASAQPGPAQGGTAQGGTAQGESAPIMQGGVDYQAYNSAAELAGVAEYAVVGKVVSAQGTWLAPTYEGDDPWLNPLAGTNREATEDEVKAGSVPVTANEVEVIESLGSPFNAGDRVEVFTPGGEVDGAQYEFEGVTHFEVGAQYLFFIGAGDGNQLGVVAVTDGAFKQESGDDYQNGQGFKLTLAEAKELLGEAN